MPVSATVIQSLFNTTRMFNVFSLVLCMLLATIAHSAAASPPPVTQAEATILNVNGRLTQNSVTAMTSDGNLISTGWSNASYDPTHGMVVGVEPGTFSIGFGSYIPERYTGPGAMYLHRVRITDQNDNVLLDEPFDGWQETNQEVSGTIARTDFSTDAGVAWASLCGLN